jgi:hypothetical protein
MKANERMITFGAAAFSSNFKHSVNVIVERVFEVMFKQMPPIPMVLFCPCCGVQHIDEPGPATKWANNDHPPSSNQWTNPPHRSHLCAACGFIWRPADICTEGVKAIETKGGKDVDITEFREGIKRAFEERESARVFPGSRGRPEET